MNKKMRIEQTPDSEFRTEYDPNTDEFRTTAYRCRSFEYGCEGYYGGLVDTGTPPEPVVVKNVIRRSFGFGGNSRSRFTSSKQIEFWIAFCCRSAFCQESSAGRSTHMFLVGISWVRY